MLDSVTFKGVSRLLLPSAARSLTAVATRKDFVPAPLPFLAPCERPAADYAIFCREIVRISEATTTTFTRARASPSSHCYHWLRRCASQGQCGNQHSRRRLRKHPRK